MRAVEPLPIFSEEELQTWSRPDVSLIKEKLRPRCTNGITALHAVLLGTSSVGHSACTHHLCPKRLRAMAMRAPQLAPDGQPWGYRVCVPWGAYQPQSPESGDQTMPLKARPHSMQQLLAAQPTIREWVEAYDHPLPPGRAPRTFERLHDKIVKELTRLGLLDCYPLNHKDRGRRALLRYLRRERVGLATEALAAETGTSKPATSLAQIFACQLYDRAEADGHVLDIESMSFCRYFASGAVDAGWLIEEHAPMIVKVVHQVRENAGLAASNDWPMQTFTGTVRFLLCNIAAKDPAFEGFTELHVQQALDACGYLTLEFVRAGLLPPTAMGVGP